VVVSFAPERQMSLRQPSLTSQESQGDYLSVAQVAQRLGCSVSLVQKWRRLGWLSATRLGPPDVPIYGYHPADVERFVRERWNRRRGRPPKASVDAVGQQRPAAGGSTVRESFGAPPPARSARPPVSPPSRSVFVHAPQPAPHGHPPLAVPPEVHPSTPGPAQKRPSAPAAPGASSIDQTPPAPLQTAAGGSRTAQPSMPPVPPSAASIAAPAAPVSTRPLVLWDGDPSHGGAVVLARFPAGQVDEALRVAGVWARRYGTLALGEAALSGEVPHVLARWHDGVQVGQ
jgi:hypothetical protein